MIEFPQDFQWGTATAAYQVEGGIHEGGRKPSIWDVFSHTPGKVERGETGDITCDHYHHWKEDVRLMKELGYKAYRFSIAWPRLLPDGIGKPNQAGIDFYNRLIDELLDAGIHPLTTLYHWDLPVSLPDGWLNRSVINAFVDFTGLAVSSFGDRVEDWITINEPFCASFLGYSYGAQAPGLQDPPRGLIAAHHLLLAHGKATQEIRSLSSHARVGIGLNMAPYYPATQSEADLAAARHADGELNRWFLDPIYGHSYPEDMVEDYVRSGVLPSHQLEFVKPGDLTAIAVPTDFLGINYYSRYFVKSADQARFDHKNLITLPAPADNETDMQWEVFPDGLNETITRVYRDYKPKAILITENGASYSDGPDANGKVHDERRIAYLKEHLGAVARAIEAGIPVKGYYVWSLLDNFEWAHGFAQRFGLVYVDYKTQQRFPKDSAYWYCRVIEHNGLAFEE